MAPKHWIPLESNPEILTKFGHALGLSPLLTFADVWSIELLAMVPAPRYAVMLLYPLTEKVLSAAAAQEKPEAIDSSKKQPYFCKQTIGNACGTIALLHAALNANSPATPLVEGSFLEQFCSKTADMTPQQRAAALHDDASLDSVHEKFAQVWRFIRREAGVFQFHRFFLVLTRLFCPFVMLIFM